MKQCMFKVKKFFIYCIIFMILSLYGVIIIYDLVWILKLKANPNNNFFPDYVEKIMKTEDLEEIKKNVVDKIPHFRDSILCDLIRYVTLLIVNMIFYFNSSRKYLIDGILELINLITTENTNDIIFALRFLYYLFLFISFSIVKFSKNLLIKLVQLMALITVLHFLSILLITKNPIKLKKRIWFFAIAGMFFAINIIVIAISFLNEHKYKKSIPDFLTGKALKNAKDFFGERIFCQEAESINMQNVFMGNKVGILFYGKWSNFSESNINALVCHEIGHGTSKTHILNLFIHSIVVLLIFYLYFEFFNIYSKGFNDTELSNSAIMTFLLAFNIYFLFLFLNISYYIISHTWEFIADRKAYQMTSSDELIEMLLKLCHTNGSYYKRPVLYSLCNVTHPSTDYRIRLANYFRR